MVLNTGSFEALTLLMPLRDLAHPQWVALFSEMRELRRPVVFREASPLIHHLRDFYMRGANAKFVPLTKRDILFSNLLNSQVRLLAGTPLNAFVRELCNASAGGLHYENIDQDALYLALNKLLRERLTTRMRRR